MLVQVLATIDRTCRARSLCGARIRWPRRAGSRGMIWFSVNMTLSWAAVRHDSELAWGEWLRMTLRAHSAAYPDTWMGTRSSPVVSSKCSTTAAERAGGPAS